MFQDVPSNTLINEGAIIQDPEVCQATVIVAPNHSYKRREGSRNSDQDFSSSDPNEYLVWAFVDDGSVESEKDKDSRHDLAVSYVEGWQPHPWKGQIWKAKKIDDKGPVVIAHSVDVIWSGRDWLPYTGLTVVDKPFVYPERSKASVGLMRAVKYPVGMQNRRAPIIPESQLNAAYVKYNLCPEDEAENLKITLFAYVRGTYILKQISKLLEDKHDIDTEESDVIMQFTLHLLQNLSDYQHTDRMGRWVKYTWKHYFFKKIQRKVIEYTNETSWMNEWNPGDDDFEALHSCMNPEKWDRGLPKLGVSERFAKELLTSDPNSPWFQLSASSKEMLQARLRGESNKQTAKGLGYTPQHVGRLLNAAIEEAKQINEKSVKDEGGLECN